MFQFVVLAALASSAWAQLHGYGGHQEHQVDHYAHPKYEFKYGVEDHHTGDVHSASESRDGDVTHGEYSLVEPDGTVRRVQYSVNGHSGFNAVVTRSGHAQHPQQSLHVQPVAVHHAPVLAVQHAPAVAVHHAPAVAVHHAPVLAVQHAPAVALHHAPAQSHGQATSYSSLVQHHQPVHHH